MNKRLKIAQPIARMLLWSLVAALMTVGGVAHAGGTAWRGPTLHAWPLGTMIAAALLCAAILPRRSQRRG